MSRESLYALLDSNILTGGRNTTAAGVREVLRAIIIEMVNIPDDLTSAPGIVAFVGGGQSSATIITQRLVRIDTCATNNDSVKLDAAVEKNERKIFNGTTQDVECFPKIGQRFRTMEDGLLAIDESIIIPGGTQLNLYCLVGEPNVYFVI